MAGERKRFFFTDFLNTSYRGGSSAWEAAASAVIKMKLSTNLLYSFRLVCFKIKGDFSTRQYTIILFVGQVMATFLSLYENKIFNFLTQLNKFYIFLTVHLRIILVNEQLGAGISSIICLFESSKCFEQLCAHLQEENCINTTSGITKVC